MGQHAHGSCHSHRSRNVRLRGKLKEIRTVFDALDVYPADALLGECEPSPWIASEVARELRELRGSEAELVEQIANLNEKLRQTVVAIGEARQAPLEELIFSEVVEVKQVA